LGKTAFFNQKLTVFGPEKLDRFLTILHGDFAMNFDL